jgi:hypothetical protein
MTDQSSPITPPPELVQQWITRWVDTCQQDCDFRTYLAIQSAQWGWDKRGTINEAQLQERADQELEACCEWTTVWISAPEASQLRAARRPKPPSLKKRIAAAIAEGNERTALLLLNEALPND